MLIKFSSFPSPLAVFQPRRTYYHNPAFDPFTPFYETYGFCGVDYPISDIGSGHAAYTKAMGTTNTVVFYRGFFTLFNITPHTLNRMRKTRRRLFYVTHYCTMLRNGQRYTVELMWPVWVGKAPRGVLTQPMPGWNNRFLKDQPQEFHIAEFAFVNLRHLWSYAHSWQQLDINRSPLGSEEMKTWWKEQFLSAVKIRPEETFGYNVYRFTEGFHQSPSFVSPVVQQAEELLAPETDRYKAAMAAVASQWEQVPESLWWTPREAATVPFIRKWAPLGLDVEPAIPIQSELPNGKWMDPDRENVTQFFDKAIDPKTYILRSDHPPLEGTLADSIAANVPSPRDLTLGRGVEGHPWKQVLEMPLFLRDIREEMREQGYDNWIKDYKNMKIMDDVIKSWIDEQIKNSPMVFTRHEERALRAALLRQYRLQQSIIPQTGIATDANAELDVDSDWEEDLWSSDDEAGYSESWMLWGDITEFREHGPTSQSIKDDVAYDLLEIWGEELTKERGSINDRWMLPELVDYEPEPEPSKPIDLPPGLPSPYKWARICRYWAPPKIAWPLTIHDDPRHEE
jgi:hypothetical protein